MKTQQIGIVSAPTTKTLAYVAEFQRRKAEAKRKQDLAQAERVRVQTAREHEDTAKAWQKLNRPFTGLTAIAEAFNEQFAAADYVATTGRLPNGKFASRRQAKQDADKLSALGFGSSE